jgi:hypothetical protein
LLSNFRKRGEANRDGRAHLGLADRYPTGVRQDRPERSAALSEYAAPSIAGWDHVHLVAYDQFSPESVAAVRKA